MVERWDWLPAVGPEANPELPSLWDWAYSPSPPRSSRSPYTPMGRSPLLPLWEVENSLQEPKARKLFLVSNPGTILSTFFRVRVLGSGVTTSMGEGLWEGP